MDVRELLRSYGMVAQGSVREGCFSAVSGLDLGCR